MLFILYMLCELRTTAFADDIKFIAFFSDDQGLKTREQTADINNLYIEAFDGGNESSEDFLIQAGSYDVFNLRTTDNDLIASVLIKRNTYYDSSGDILCSEKFRAVTALEIYSLAFSKDFIGKKLCRAFLNQAIPAIQTRYQLRKDTIISLHINPRDPMMAVSFAIYIKYGFDKATRCDSGPSDLKYELQTIEKLDHPVIEAINIIKDNSASPQKYMAMYIKASNFMRCKHKYEMEELIFLGKLLVEKMKKAH